MFVHQILQESYYVAQKRVGSNKKGSIKMFRRERKNIKRREIGEKNNLELEKT
jgi:hypothetical protein